MTEAPKEEDRDFRAGDADPDAVVQSDVAPYDVGTFGVHAGNLSTRESLQAGDPETTQTVKGELDEVLGRWATEPGLWD